ncbi:MAG TPA: alpha/beta hydrolase-fold protein [Ferruginibacter sp.]|mgnify:CR=1 FL=1|nr:alpha/beta hydrolase-fold protein [Ferruginibacter sp.]
MKKILCLVALIFAFAKTEAQYRVIFKLISYPSSHKGDSIFIAGNFNGWNPGNTSYSFSSNSDNILQLSTQLDAGNYEYKCTRGSWQKVEVKNDGADIGNRSFQLRSDTVIEINIGAWKDDLALVERKHTASSNVQVMDTGFFMPQLNRTRKIWIYLPEEYAKTKKRYPVLYMHDGQNLFDEYTSGFGEWGVDESLDSLISKGKTGCIVIGIENGPQRFNEYNPFVFEQFGKGEGDAYVDFLTQTLKPYIDKNYRTLSSRENTLIAGSSMGGLISYYAMLKRPDVFGRGGIFSPAFWTAAAIKPLTDSLGAKMTGKFFFYMGGREGGTYIQDMLDVQESLGERSSSMIYSLIDPVSGHNEQAWRKWFAEFYNWIMADGFNYVVKTKE